MYTQQKILVRPRSSLSNDENRMKSSLQPRQKPSVIVLSLIGLCVFLLVMCICLIFALVFVGKNFANSKNLNLAAKPDVISAQQSFNHYTISNSPYLIQRRPVVVFKPNQITSDESDKLEKSASESNNLSDSAVKVGSDNMTGTKKIISKVIEKLTFRLPSEIRPIKYNLYLHPNLQEKTYSGNVKIQFNLTKSISFIPVHSKKLSIETSSVQKFLDNGQTEDVKVFQSFSYEPHEYWVTEFENDLEAGDYEINLKFNGSLTNRIVGFYQSSYFDSKSNGTRVIATSKFEPTYARQAFPCFDEPDMKAKFTVSIAYPHLPGYHALSNMDEKSKEVIDDYNKVTFSESVPMSTYLVCFIVSDFVYKEKQVISPNKDGKNFKMRAYATPAQLDKVDFPLDTGVSITQYYIGYFGIEYPLPKLDMAAIPDFVSGAMEHWGLVTYRETSLLYDKKISSTANKQRVGEVIAHELAHMWFGNLVTMKWWNDLWLNEGFASYIEYKGLQNTYPGWGMMDQFLIQDLHGVMKLDATLASHPIVQTVESPDEITELFDTITYQKGSSIIRMLEDFVTPEKFRTAVTKYLNTHAYSNAVTDDLLHEIELMNLGFDIKIVMETWTKQMGLPVVNVEKISDTQYKLTQKRFLANPEDADKEYDDSPFNYNWYIFVRYSTSEMETHKTESEWFPNHDAEVVINVPEKVKWIKINKDQIGFYRVNYEKDMWQDLIVALKTDLNVMSTSDRAHLLNDAFALADAEQLPYDTALELTRYLTKETEYVPWAVIQSKLISLKNILFYTDALAKFEEYARTLVKGVYEKVGWDIDDNEEKHLENRLRMTVLELACAMGVEDCLNKTQEVFNRWIDNPKEYPHPDIRNIVYYYGMASVKDEKVWNTVWERFLKEQDASEKSKLMYGLSAIKVPWILKRYIEYAWDEKNVRRQDYFTCIQYIAANRVGENIVWDYVRGKWEDYVARYGLNERYLGRLIPSITGQFSTKVKLQDMQDFFNRYPEAGAGTAARKQALESVRSNIKWLSGNKELVEEWLNQISK